MLEPVCIGSSIVHDLVSETAPDWPSEAPEFRVFNLLEFSYFHQNRWEQQSAIGCDDGVEPRRKASTNMPSCHLVTWFVMPSGPISSKISESESSNRLLLESSKQPANSVPKGALGEHSRGGRGPA